MKCARCQCEHSEASARIMNALKLIEKNGCDCECRHHWEDHDEDCERCLACLIEYELNPLAIRYPLPAETLGISETTPETTPLTETRSKDAQR